MHTAFQGAIVGLIVGAVKLFILFGAGGESAVSTDWLYAFEVSEGFLLALLVFEVVLDQHAFFLKVHHFAMVGEEVLIIFCLFLHISQSDVP
jgi:hypothetical protein